MAIIERTELVQIEEYIIAGQYKEALQINSGLKKSDKKLTANEKNQIKLLLATLQLKQGNFKKAVKNAESIFKRAQKKKDDELSLWATNIIIEALTTSSDFDNLQIWIDKGEELFSTLRELEEIEIKSLLAQYLLVKGNYLCNIGDFEEARINLHQALFIVEQFNEHPLKADILASIASLYQKQGNIDLAIETFQQSLDIWEALNNPFSIAEIKNYLATILAFQGDIHLALGILQQELEIVMRNTNKHIIAEIQKNIGLIYLDMNKFDIALEWMNLSLKNFRSTGNKRKIAEILYYQILLNHRINDQKKIEASFNQLISINSKSNDLMVNQWYWLGQAILLCGSTRYSDLSKTEEIYYDIIKGKELEQRITIIAMLNLCQIQLDSLLLNKDEKLLLELESNLERLLAIADLQDSYILFTKTYILQAQVKILEEDIDRAQELLNQALSLAQLKELHKLVEEINSITEVLNTKLALWEKLYNYNASLIDLIELTPYEKSVKHIAKEKMFQKIKEQNEDPILILIQDPSGTSIYSKKFLPNSEFDEQLISAFLFAINNFMQETFAGKGAIDRITYLDYTILFKPKSPFLICYAYRGQSYTAEQNIDRFTDKLDNKLSTWQALVNYTKTGLVPELEDLIVLEDLIDEIFNIPESEIEEEFEEELMQDHLSELLSSKL